MNYLEKLLQGAPVEWKTLGEVADIGTGSSNRQDESENGKYPFYVRSKNILKSDTYQFDETAIVVPGEGGIGDIFHFVEGKYALHQRAYRIHVHNKELLPIFLYYVMTCHFKKYIISKSVGATATSIRKPMLEKFSIPIPPLAVQKEIARILDRFTALTSELTLRQKQYQHYRDKLLTFGDEVEWKTLGEVAPPIRGKRVVRAELNENGIYPVYQNSLKPLGFYDKTNCRKYSTFIIAAGAAGEVGFSDVDFWAADDCYYFKCPEILNDKFLYYFLLKENHKLFSQVRRASIPRLGKTAIESLKIPLPPLEEQKRIATILDKFHTLTSSLSDGLPKEIELRQKQYEYYRDLLLGFDYLK